jgi:hypothetical protein
LVPFFDPLQTLFESWLDDEARIAVGEQVLPRRIERGPVGRVNAAYGPKLDGPFEGHGTAKDERRKKVRPRTGALLGYAFGGFAGDPAVPVDGLAASRTGPFRRRARRGGHAFAREVDVQRLLYYFVDSFSPKHAQRLKPVEVRLFKAYSKLPQPFAAGLVRDEDIGAGGNMGFTGWRLHTWQPGLTRQALVSPVRI